MPGRPLPDRLRTWLTGEIESWCSGGVLSPEQARRILDLYETPTEAANRRHSIATFTLMALAALLVGMAVLLVIGYNWEQMPAAAKLVVIFGTVVATYAGAFGLRYGRQARLLSEVLFFLGGIFYGCAIWLIAQVFHIQSHFPDGLWYWALGLLPLVLCLDSLLLHFLYVALLALWVGTEILGFGRPIPWLFLRGWHVADAAYSLPLLALPGLLWAYQKRSALAVGLYVPLLTWWVVLQPVAWHWHEQSVYVIGAVGALLWLLAELHRQGSLLAIPYRLYGVLLLAGTLVPLTFAAFHRDVLRHAHAGAGFVVAVAIAVMGMAVVGLRVVLRRGVPAAPGRPAHEATQAVLRRWLPAGLLVLMAGLALWHAAFHEPMALSRHLPPSSYAMSLPVVVLPMLAANVAMLVLAFWLMRVGLHEDRVLPFAGGVALFLLWAVLRYSDLFGDAGGMLGGAAVFFLCGAALFGVAWFWRHRKEIGYVR